MNELQRSDVAEVSRTGLSFAPETTLEEWLKIGEQLQYIQGSLNWWLGDWLHWGERRSWGDMYTQALTETNYKYGTLSNYAWVASHVDFERRRESLSWSHHYEVAALDLHDQEHYLSLAVIENLSVRAMRDLIRGDKGKHVVTTLIDEKVRLDELYAMLEHKLKDIAEDATVRIRIEIKA